MRPSDFGVHRPVKRFAPSASASKFSSARDESLRRVDRSCARAVAIGRAAAIAPSEARDDAQPSGIGSHSRSEQFSRAYHRSPCNVINAPGDLTFKRAWRELVAVQEDRASGCQSENEEPRRDRAEPGRRAPERLAIIRRHPRLPNASGPRASASLAALRRDHSSHSSRSVASPVRRSVVLFHQFRRDFP